MKTVYLSKEILKNNQLTPATKLVAHHLFHLSGWEEENTIQSAREIAKQLGITKPSALSALKTLQDLNFLKINEDNTFKFFINGISFNKADLSNKQCCNLVGDFVVVPTFSLYCDELTPAERDAYFKFFDFYFKIENKTFNLKKSEIHISSVATYYGDSERSFQKHIQNIKEKGYIDYKSLKTTSSGDIKTKLIGVKAFTAEKRWIINNGKTIKTKEEVITSESFTEEEPITEHYVEQSCEDFFIGQFEYYSRIYNSKFLMMNGTLYSYVKQSIQELGKEKTIELLKSCNLSNTVTKEQLTEEEKTARLNEIIEQAEIYGD